MLRLMWGSRLKWLSGCNRRVAAVIGHSRWSTWQRAPPVGPRDPPRFCRTARASTSTALKQFWLAFLSTLQGFWGVGGTSPTRCGSSWMLPCRRLRGCWWQKQGALGLGKSHRLQKCRPVCLVFMMLLHLVRTTLQSPCSRPTLRGLRGYTELS